MNNIVCYYHSADLDGKCSAAIVHYWENKAELIPLNYNDNFKAKILDRKFVNEIIFFCDIIAPIDIMRELSGINDVIILDHHITAIDAIKEAGFYHYGKLDISKASCELTWEYLFPNTKIPKVVKYLGRYDVWQHNNEIVYFQYGMREQDLPVNSHIWEMLFENDRLTEHIINTGRIIKSWVDITNEKHVKIYNREGCFEGLRAVICNNVGGSPLFDSVYNPDLHDIMVTYIHTSQKTWQYGLYSTKDNVHCGEIAKKFGGGGHKGAAGFTIGELII